MAAMDGEIVISLDEESIVLLREMVVKLDRFHADVETIQAERRKDAGTRGDNNKHLGGPHVGGA